MARPHDVGGFDGVGPIPIERDEPVFHADWERRVFGAFFSTWGTVTNLDEVRDARERIPPETFYASTYYERWVESLEMILLEKGVVSETELAASQERHRTNPGTPMPSNDDPDRTAHALQVLYEGGDGWRDIEAEPAFAAGDRVVTKRSGWSGHTRLPHYVLGRIGVVDHVHGAYVLPDTNHAGRGEHAQHVYAVRFDSSELWGSSAEAGTSVTIDLWECYLETADA